MIRRPGRLHAPELEALAAAADGGIIALRAPGPGVFTPAVGDGDLVSPGGVLGELAVLGRVSAVLAPAGAAGLVVRGPASRAVGYGDTLVAIDPALQRGGVVAPAAAQATAGVSGLVFRAPTSGRFYSRSAPDKPAFVTAGAMLGPGATICLLEVMKTFHRVTYGGPGLPESATVARVLVNDGDDVNAGDPLLALA